jgi:hypothetical protein
MMKMSAGSSRLLTTLGLAGTLMLASQSPLLAAECKGMEKAACERQDSCTWVDSYQRKDGVKVSGYCRGKGGKKSSSSSSSSDSSSSSTTS